MYETTALAADAENTLESFDELHRFVAAQKSGELLRWEIGRGKEIVLNPDLEKWKNREAALHEIAAVCPDKVEIDGGQAFIAIDFSGDIQFLDRVPNWAERR